MTEMDLWTFTLSSVSVYLVCTLLFLAGQELQGQSTILSSEVPGISSWTAKMNTLSDKDYNVKTGFCTKAQLDQKTCTDEITQGGSQNYNLFDVVAGLLNVAGYTIKFFEIVAMSALLEFFIIAYLSHLGIPTMLFTLITLFLLFWKMTFIYQVVRVVIGNRRLQ